jgi:hypothetical protein
MFRRCEQHFSLIFVRFGARCQRYSRSLKPNANHQDLAQTKCTAQGSRRTRRAKRRSMPRNRLLGSLFVSQNRQGIAFRIFRGLFHKNDIGNNGLCEIASTCRRSGLERVPYLSICHCNALWGYHLVPQTHTGVFSWRSPALRPTN